MVVNHIRQLSYCFLPFFTIKTLVALDSLKDSEGALFFAHILVKVHNIEGHEQASHWS